MVRLRKLEPSDLPFLYWWENDAAVWADSDTHNPLSQQDLRSYIENTTGDIYRDGQLRLIIENDTDHSTLGCVDLFDFDPRNRKAAIGLYIAPEARRSRVGYETMKLLEQYAFGTLNMRLLYAVIRASNGACLALYQSLGYEQIAVLPQWTLESEAYLLVKYNK